MRKKLLLPLLFLAMMATLTACKKNDSISHEDDRITIKADITSEGGDLSVASATEDAKEDESEVISYEVKTELYEKDQISIEYPVLEGNIPNIDQLNSTLYEENMGGVEYLTDFYTLEQKIEIKEQSDEIISIVCKGYCTYNNASYPLAIFTAFNIDVKNGTFIEFQDHEQVSEKVNNKEFEILDLPEGMDLEAAKDEVVMNYNLSSAFPMYYIQDGVEYYMVPVSHESGDNMTIVLTEE